MRKNFTVNHGYTWLDLTKPGFNMQSNIERYGNFNYITASRCILLKK